VNNYTRLSHLKQGMGRTTAVSDVMLLRAIEAASRFFDRESSRPMFSTIATRYVAAPYAGESILDLNQDLLSITTLKYDSAAAATFTATLVVNTDYWLPDSAAPIRSLELNPLSSILTSWPSIRRRIQIVGAWGYSNATEPAGTLGAAITTTTATAVTMTAGHTVEAGDTIVVGSEQMDVSAVLVNTLTVARGINGSTAATALINAAVANRRYPADVEEAIQLDAARTIHELQTGASGQLANGEFGGSSFSASYPKIRDVIQHYRILVVA